MHLWGRGEGKVGGKGLSVVEMVLLVVYDGWGSNNSQYVQRKKN